MTVSTLIEDRVAGPVAIAFWPWSSEAPALATLRTVIASAPDTAAIVMPEGAIAAELIAHLTDSARARISQLAGDGLGRFLNQVAAAHPAADLAIVADAGELPAGWLAGLWAAAHAEDTIAVGTARASGGGAPTLASLDSAALAPTALEPTALEPAALEPAALEPAALEPAALDPAALDPAALAEPGARSRPPLRGLLAPRVLLAEPNACLIRRPAFELLGGLDQRLTHPQALLADFAARGRELGLTCALAPETIIRRTDGGLGPCPPTELAELNKRHPWLRAARTDELALDPGPLKHSLIATRASRGVISVTVDARTLGSGFGGTQTYVRALLVALARSGAVSVRAVLAGEPEPELREELIAAGVEIVTYEEAASGELPRTDVIHRPQQVFTPSDLRLLQLVGERLVVTQMDLIAYHTPTYHESIDAWRAYRRTSRLALAAADRAVFFSGHARRDALGEELIAEDRAVIAGIGVVPSAPASDSDRPARVPAATDLLLMLGADYSHKNRPFAIRLLDELTRRHGWQGMLVLAGAHVPHGSSAVAEAEVLAARPDLAAHVIDLGPVSEPEKRWLLHAAIAHLAPSTYEGFGLAPLEAAAAGRPCIYAPRSSLAEIIDPDGATIVPWDPAASADAVIELLAPGPARTRHLALLTGALQSHTWDRVVPQILAAYEGAIHSPYRGAAPRAWADLEREELAAGLNDAYRALLARVSNGIALIDTQGPLLTPAQQRGLMRVAARPWLRSPLLGGFGLLGADHRAPRPAGRAGSTPRTAGRADGERTESAP